MDYSQAIDDIYENLQDYNSRKKIMCQQFSMTYAS